MPSFRKVDLIDFIAKVSSVDFPPALGIKRERLDRRMLFDDAGDQPCMIHDGTLVQLGHFRLPAYHVLIDGDLIVNGRVDTHFPGADEGGSFFVTGNVTCNIYLGHWGKMALIGGDLSARDMLLNAYTGSFLAVGGRLKTRFFIGFDIWAEVGRGADMEYGFGYCLPLGYGNARHEAILPRHDRETSAAVLAIDDAGALSSPQIAHHIRSGAPIFR